MYKLHLYRRKDKITFSAINLRNNEEIEITWTGLGISGYVNSLRKIIGFNLDSFKERPYFIPLIIVHELAHTILPRREHHDLLHRLCPVVNFYESKRKKEKAILINRVNKHFSDYFLSHQVNPGGETSNE